MKENGLGGIQMGRLNMLVLTANGVGNDGDISEIILKIIIAAISGFIGVMFTHIFYKSKLKKEQKVRFDNVVGDRIADSLIKIRDIELISSTIEIYDINGLLSKKGSKTDFLNEGPRYLAIFNDWKTYNDFMHKITEVRQTLERDVDCEVALYLVFIERYLYQLSTYMSEFRDEKLLPVLGTIFTLDIQKWQMSFDKVLIKKINSHICKLESHDGIKWKIKRKRIVEKPWKESILQMLITGITVDEKGRRALPELQKFIDSIKENPENYYM